MISYRSSHRQRRSFPARAPIGVRRTPMTAKKRSSRRQMQTVRRPRTRTTNRAAGSRRSRTSSAQLHLPRTRWSTTEHRTRSVTSRR
jgi:hypothetical protein